MDDNKLSLMNSGFEWGGAIASATFPELRLTAAEILTVVE
jgi:hypothetical protein